MPQVFVNHSCLPNVCCLRTRPCFAVCCKWPSKKMIVTACKYIIRLYIYIYIYEYIIYTSVQWDAVGIVCNSARVYSTSMISFSVSWYSTVATWRFSQSTAYESHGDNPDCKAAYSKRPTNSQVVHRCFGQIFMMLCDDQTNSILWERLGIFCCAIMMMRDRVCKRCIQFQYPYVYILHTWI